MFESNETTTSSPTDPSPPSPSPSSAHGDPSTSRRSSTSPYQTTSSVKPPTRKRRRGRNACSECKRRKQRCDRASPCSQCIARNVVRLCQPVSEDVRTTMPERGSRQSSLTLNNRLGSLEHMIKTFMEHFEPALSVVRSNSKTPGLRSVEDGPSAATSNASGRLRQFSTLHTAPGSGLPVRRTNGDVRHQQAQVALYEAGQTLADAEEEALARILARLPATATCQRLVDYYLRIYREIDWTRYKVHKPWFMTQYDHFFASGETPAPSDLGVETILWLPTFLIALAITTHVSRTSQQRLELVEKNSWVLYRSACEALRLAVTVDPTNIHLISASVLIARYLGYLSRNSDCRLPVSMAYNMSLHRDGTLAGNATGDLDVVQVELRRRAWAMLYHSDRSLALDLGRPTLIDEDQVDTLAPANLEDEELGGLEHPLHQPTTYSYAIHRHDLAHLMGRVAKHTMAVKTPPYTAVEGLDRDLFSWSMALPSFLRIQDPDASMDPVHPYLFVHRFLLACEWYFTRITLHRPYFLPRKADDTRFEASYNAIISSARADLLNRREFELERLKRGIRKVDSGGYRVLNSYLILGITIKVDPLSEEAHELRTLLRVVSGKESDDLGRTSAPLVPGEMAMIEYFIATPQQTTPVWSSRQETLQNSPKRVIHLLKELAMTRSGRWLTEEEAKRLVIQENSTQELNSPDTIGGTMGRADTRSIATVLTGNVFSGEQPQQSATSLLNSNATHHMLGADLIQPLTSSIPNGHNFMDSFNDFENPNLWQLGSANGDTMPNDAWRPAIVSGPPPYNHGGRPGSFAPHNVPQPFLGHEDDLTIFWNNCLTQLADGQTITTEVTL